MTNSSLANFKLKFPSDYHHHQLTFLEWPKWLTLLQGPLFWGVESQTVS